MEQQLLYAAVQPKYDLSPGSLNKSVMPDQKRWSNKYFGRLAVDVDATMDFHFAKTNSGEYKKYSVESKLLKGHSVPPVHNV